MRSLHNALAKFILVLCAGIIAVPASANDSLATLGAGGLELTSSDDIVMEREELFLSTEEVRVRYVFRNESSEDITTRVAFPLPDVPFGPADNVDLPHMEDDNFVGFSVLVDGQPVDPELEQRAISSFVESDNLPPSPYPDDTDITDVVLKAGLQLNPNLPGWQETVTALPSDKRSQLVEQGLLYLDGLDPETYGPQWALREAYHWEQTFPAHKPVVVEHHYQPVVGSSYLVGEDGDLNELSEEYERQYCLDSAGKAGVRRLIQKAAKANARGGDESYVLADEVSYLLTTGANWKGPIGHFELTIDKITPHAILSLCMDGIKKTGPTTFKVERDNFTPEEDIGFVVFHLEEQGE